jgi:hypothetical protein
MKLHLKPGGLFIMVAIFIVSCQKSINDESVSDLQSKSSAAKNSGEKLKNDELKLNISGLEDLGPNARYEGWVIIDGAPVTTGIFTVNNSGQMSQTVFEIPATVGKLKNAVMFVLTIEPFPDNNPGPSAQHLLAGNFNEESAILTIGHPAALNTNFSMATGHFLLATPTTASTMDELSGMWFINNMSGSPAAGLHLPVLPTGWRYEGWALISGKPVTTGTFTNGMMADNAASFSGPVTGPPFPGEDFITNAPMGLTFPTNLSGGMSVISVEPYPDNSPAPFLLKPLVRMIPNPAQQHFAYSMNLNPGSYPTGTAVTKK